MPHTFLLQGYAWHFGALWAGSSDEGVAADGHREREVKQEAEGDLEAEGSKEAEDGIWASYSAPVTWLLDARNIAVPSPQLQSEQWGWQG
jgi:hypothetical protein